jgi:hypothetical protein
MQVARRWKAFEKALCCDKLLLQLLEALLV